MACHVLYQPNRYSIIRGVGCTVTQVMTWPTLILRVIWAPFFAVGGTLYSSKIYRRVNMNGISVDNSHSIHSVPSHPSSTKLRACRCGRSFSAYHGALRSSLRRDHVVPVRGCATRALVGRGQRPDVWSLLRLFMVVHSLGGESPLFDYPSCSDPFLAVESTPCDLFGNSRGGRLLQLGQCDRRAHLLRGLRVW